MTTTTTPDAGGQRRPFRRNDDKVIGGVASGLADYLNVPPLWVRVAFVVLATAGLAGVVIYAVLLFLLPEDGQGDARITVRDLDEHKGWVVLGVLAFIVVAGVSGFHGVGFIGGVALAVIGVFLLLDRQAPPLVGASRPTANGAPTYGPPTPSEADPTTQQADAKQQFSNVDTSSQWTQRFATSSYGATESVSTVEAKLRSVKAKVQREKDATGLALLTWGALLLAVGALVGLQQLGATHLSLQQFCAVGLFVVGLGFLIGTFVGRITKLVSTAVLLTLLLLIASVMGSHFIPSTGTTYAAPRTITELQPAYELGAGKNIVDLSAITTTDGSTRRIDITTNAGFTVVVVPAALPTFVQSATGFGYSDVLGTQEAGVHKRISVSRLTGPEGFNALDITIHQGAGRVLVTANPNEKDAQR